LTESQNVSGKSLGLVMDTTHEVVIWGKEYRSGNMIYPYAKAKGQ